jgi:hypothetical protein
LVVAVVEADLVIQVVVLEAQVAAHKYLLEDLLQVLLVHQGKVIMVDKL